MLVFVLKFVRASSDHLNFDILEENNPIEGYQDGSELLTESVSLFSSDSKSTHNLDLDHFEENKPIEGCQVDSDLVVEIGSLDSSANESSDHADLDHFEENNLIEGCRDDSEILTKNVLLASSDCKSTDHADLDHFEENNPIEVSQDGLYLIDETASLESSGRESSNQSHIDHFKENNQIEKRQNYSDLLHQNLEYAIEPVKKTVSFGIDFISKKIFFWNIELRYIILERLIDVVGLYMNWQYRYLISTHPYMQDHYNNHIKYAKILKPLLRHNISKFSIYILNLDKFCDILELETEKTESKSRELQGYKNLLDRMYYDFTMNHIFEKKIIFDV